MKKLLVVMLVLAMAGMANAAMELSIGTSVNVGESLTFSIVAPTEIAQGGYFVSILDGGTGTASFDLASAVINYTGTGSNVATGNDGDIESLLSTSVDYIAAGLVDTHMPPPPLAPVVGTLISSIKLNGLTAGDVTIRAMDASFETWIDYTVTVGSIVPEPITIGLLGLGGLFLRRRSK